MAFLLEYKFYSEKWRILLQTLGGWSVPLALGITRNQPSSSTCVALHIQESKVIWSPWCIQNWIPFYYTGSKKDNWTRQKYYFQGQPQNSFKSSLLFQYLKLKGHQISLQLSTNRVLKKTLHLKLWEDNPTFETPRGKTLGLKYQEVLGAFLQEFPISSSFYSPFSFPLPCHFLHLHFPLIACVQNSQMPFINLSPFLHSDLPTLTLISPLPATQTTPHHEKCSLTFLTLSGCTSSHVKEISIREMVRVEVS